MNRQIIYRILRDFDKDGNLTVATTEYQSSEEPTIVTKFTCPEFDKKVNWLTQYAWEDGEVVGITKREISYR